VRARSWVPAGFAAVTIAVFGGVALIPPESGSRERVFEIPPGTWARRMAGEKIETLPDHIFLTVGVRDILVLKNQDVVPQTFGPTLMMPGQSFTLPFERAAEYQFACTAHASGQMTISVDPYPATPWARVSWRARELLRRL
jgi:hypothetical protein